MIRGDNAGLWESESALFCAQQQKKVSSYLCPELILVNSRGAFFSIEHGAKTGNGRCCKRTRVERWTFLHPAKVNICERHRRRPAAGLSKHHIPLVTVSQIQHPRGNEAGNGCRNEVVGASPSVISPRLSNRDVLHRRGSRQHLDKPR